MPNYLLRRDHMKERGDKTYLAPDLSRWISDIAFSRFRSFCSHILGVKIDEIPSEQSIFMRQNFSIILYAAILYLFTNGFYLVKNIILKTMIPIDMVPLYMMVASSLAMLLFLALCKRYDSTFARFALLGYYTMIIASVTIFMVSCNYHGIGLSISMCYLFVIMIAPTYKTLDTVIICVLIALSWWLPSQLPYAENYDLFKHFLLCFSIVVGFIAIRSIFLRQSRNERAIKEMTHSFIKLAYNDVMTGTLNKKAMETYCAFIAEKMAPETVSAIIYDVDDFKSYNDHYTHIKGDEALRLIAESVVCVLERSDRYLFRFGGEEFVVILPGVAEDEARCIALELLGAVRAAAIPRDDLPGKGIVTASFGVASASSRELSDLSVIAKADRQLYVCKKGEKDCVAAGNIIYQ